MANKTNIYDELRRIQTEIKAPKSQFNEFGNFHYRSLEDIIEAYKKIAKKTTLTIKDEIILIGKRYYVKATATLALPDGQSTSTTAYAREAEKKTKMDDAQITGATSTYARKYALNGLFAIDDIKDQDQQKKMTKSQLKKAIEKIDNVEELTQLYQQYSNEGEDIVKLFAQKQQSLINSKKKDVK